MRQLAASKVQPSLPSFIAPSGTDAEKDCENDCRVRTTTVSPKLLVYSFKLIFAYACIHSCMYLCTVEIELRDATGADSFTSMPFHVVHCRL